MRAIIKYSREGSAKYISHLDMQRLFARAFRRTDIPVSFSKGFNPHIVMSFASPLSVGYATYGDYLEVKTEKNVDGALIKSKLNEVMPSGMSIVFAGELPENAPKLMAANSSAIYILQFESDITKKAEEFFAAKEFIATDKKGRSFDVRPLVIDGKIDSPTKVTVKVQNSSEKALNPAILVNIFSGQDEAEITRIECFAKTSEGEVPFFCLAEK